MGEAVLSRSAIGFAALLAVACLVGFWLSSPVVALPAAVLTTALAARFVSRAVAHTRLARSLLSGSRAGSHGGVELRWRSFEAGAAVAGLRRPAIFCDPALRGQLTARELEAVVLHERHHQLRRDPGRLLVLAAAEPIARLHPTGRAWLAHRRARIEVAADRHALDSGASRPALAGAIMKLADTTTSSVAAGFSSAQELRLRALVRDEDVLEPPLPRRSIVAAAVVAALLACAGMIAHHQLFATTGGVGCLFAGC